MTDINNDGENDLILRDDNNLYVKYRNENTEYENTQYINDYYKHDISSYKDLIDESEDGFVKINDIYIKLADDKREVKNFKYNGADYDSIKVSWMNSNYM